MGAKIEDPPQLEWIKLSEDLDKMLKTETMLEKMKRKTKENPFVPFGCLATFAALSYGLWAFKKGESKTSQKMMRMRVGAQAFTIIAFVVGLGLSTTSAAKT